MISIKLDDGRQVLIDAIKPHEAMLVAEGCKELSGFRNWWRIAIAVASVRSIDGIPIPLPIREKHVEGMVGRFSREELNSIIDAAESQPLEEFKEELELTRLTPVETLKLWAVVGDFEAIPGWVAPAFIAASVRKIDGEKIVFPSSKKDLRELVERLGSSGLTKAASILETQAEAYELEEESKRVIAKN